MARRKGLREKGQKAARVAGAGMAGAKIAGKIGEKTALGEHMPSSKTPLDRDPRVSDRPRGSGKVVKPPVKNQKRKAPGGVKSPGVSKTPPPKVPGKSLKSRLFKGGKAGLVIGGGMVGLSLLEKYMRGRKGGGSPGEGVKPSPDASGDTKPEKKPDKKKPAPEKSRKHKRPIKPKPAGPKKPGTPVSVNYYDGRVTSRPLGLVPRDGRVWKASDMARLRGAARKELRGGKQSGPSRRVHVNRPILVRKGDRWNYWVYGPAWKRTPQAQRARLDAVVAKMLNRGKLSPEERALIRAYQKFTIKVYKEEMRKSGGKGAVRGPAHSDASGDAPRGYYTQEDRDKLTGVIKKYVRGRKKEGMLKNKRKRRKVDRR